MRKASIVIPCYNGECFINDAVGSCLGQTEKDIEVIVVNDGSTDSTKEILDYLMKQDDRLRVLENDKNMGRSYSRNRGWMAADSEYIFVLDADDQCVPNRVEEVLKAFKETGADVIYTSFDFINTYGDIVGVVKANPFDIEKNLKDKENYICHSSMAYKNLVRNKSMYDAGEYSKLGIDDWKLQLELHKAGCSFYAIDKRLVQYRPIGGTVGNRDEAKVKEVKDKYLETY